MASSANADPKFIQYLLDPEEEYEFYYIVGNRAKNTPVERIGVVKKMLIAHSDVFKRELQDSKLKDKTDTEITDVFPSTFKNLLRHVYGYDNTTALTFEDADDLLYVADKYMIDKLKGLLSSRLMDLLSCDNICSLMNNPSVYRVLELNHTITKIIQNETNRVLASPQFLGLSADAFLKILEQQRLQAPEIELWRAAVKWARSRVNSEDGPTLRKELGKHVQHIRVCTLSLKEFCGEVVPTDIVTDAEVKQVCMFLANKDRKPELREICDNVVPRTSCPPYRKSDPIEDTFPTFPTFPTWSLIRTESILRIDTKSSHLELCSLVVSQGEEEDPQGDFTIVVEKLNSTTKPKTIARPGLQASSKYEFEISLEGEDVILLPDSQYKITFRSSPSHCVWLTKKYHSKYLGDNFTVYYETDTDGSYVTSVRIITYKTLHPQNITEVAS